jgi:hypothetical protein
MQAASTEGSRNRRIAELTLATDAGGGVGRNACVLPALRLVAGGVGRNAYARVERRIRQPLYVYCRDA